MTSSPALLKRLASRRRRRGCTERVPATRSFVVDPEVIGMQDDVAATHLVSTAAGVVRDVTRMQAAAGQRGERLLTFTVEAEVGLEAPEDLERVTEALARTVAAFDGPGRRCRVIIGGHPAPAKEEA